MLNGLMDQSLDDDHRLKFKSRFHDRADEDSSRPPISDGNESDDSEEMADPEERPRKTRTPKFDSRATAVKKASSSQHHQGRGQTPLWVKERSKTLWEQYNSDECPDEEFKKVFRMSKATLNMICDELHSAVTKKDTINRLVIPGRQRVAVCLYRLATADPWQTVSNFFGLGISACRKLVLEVCDAIRTVLSPKFIRWPDKERLEQIKTEFGSVSGIPNISGSIYTTHVSIIAPKNHDAKYLNKKHTERNKKPSYSTKIQGVVDSRGVFTDIAIGWPGSMADGDIFVNSSLSRRIDGGKLKDISIVGSSNYPLLDYLLVPHTHENKSWIQHSFNEKIGEVQKIAKDAFMRLKGRWACLQKGTKVKLQDLLVILEACCVLHNICEINNEAMDEDLKFDLFDDEPVIGENDRGESTNDAMQVIIVEQELEYDDESVLIGFDIGGSVREEHDKSVLLGFKMLDTGRYKMLGTGRYKMLDTGVSIKEEHDEYL